MSVAMFEEAFLAGMEAARRLETEPVYEYIKGQGWVPTTAPQGPTAIIEGYRVTVVQRRPQMGEYFFNELTNTTPQDTLKNLTTQEYRFRGRDLDKLEMPKYYTGYGWGGRPNPMTILVEKL